MLKQILILLIVSLLIVVGMSYAQEGLQYLVSAHDWINDQLTQVFSGGQAGTLLRQLIALIAVPVIVGLIPAIAFWMVKRRWLSCFMTIIWVVWLVQTGALVILHKASDAII